MSQIHGKDTKPEMEIRRALHKLGFRYQLHRKDLPGKPDLVFPKYGTVLFVNGCFWHRHGCRKTTTPKTNSEFWQKKFMENEIRDKKNIAKLETLGWKVLLVWECQIKEDPFKTANNITEQILISK